jgi:hypothetical protein
MPKTQEHLPDLDITKDSSVNNSIIFIVILLCIIVIGSFFMFKVYKKLQMLNNDVINITTRGDSFDSNSKEHNRQIDILAEHLRRVETNVTKVEHKMDPPKHVEISLDNPETKVLEDITEE